VTEKGLTTPLSRWVQVFDCLCRCIDWGLGYTSYWIDTLVLKTEGNTYSTLLHHPFLFKGKPTQEVAGFPPTNMGPPCTRVYYVRGNECMSAHLFFMHVLQQCVWGREIVVYIDLERDGVCRKEYRVCVCERTSACVHLSSLWSTY
jgi:hypothetical protein